MCRPWTFVFFSFLTLVVLGVCIWKALQYNPTCDDYCKWGALGGVCLFAYSVAWAICKFEFSSNTIICNGKGFEHSNQSPQIHSDITSGFIVTIMEFPCCCLCHLHQWIFSRIICCATKIPDHPHPTHAQASTPYAQASAPPLPLTGEPKAPCV
jgi:hypothetical protein